MKIFKAEPIESKLNDPRWARSDHKGWVILRAENEEKAKSIATIEFFPAVIFVPGTDVILGNPWRDGLVNYTEIDDPDYPVDGKEGVIDKG